MPIVPSLGRTTDREPYITEQSNGNSNEAVRYLDDSREVIGATNRISLEREDPIDVKRWEDMGGSLRAQESSRQPRSHEDELRESFAQASERQLLQHIASASWVIADVYREGVAA